MTSVRERILSLMEAGHFYPGPLGLPTTSPPVAAIRAARERFARQAAEAHGDIFEPTTDYRWTGFLFEAALAAWLREEGIPYERHGGVDRLPDFEIAGLAVGAKCRAWRWSRGAAPPVMWPSVQRIPDAVVFGAWDPDEETVTILGVAARRIVASATLVRKGQEIAPGVAARADNLRLEHERLTSPVAWIQDVYVERLQFA